MLDIPFFDVKPYLDFNQWKNTCWTWHGTEGFLGIITIQGQCFKYFVQFTKNTNVLNPMDDWCGSVPVIGNFRNRYYHLRRERNNRYGSRPI